MSGNFTRQLAGIAAFSVFALGLVANGDRASATVLLDTFTAGSPAIFGVARATGVPFSSATDATITDISADLTGSGSVELGIMLDAAGLPSGTFLDSVTLATATSNPTSVSWAIAAGNYWLVAVQTTDTEVDWDAGTITGPGELAFISGGALGQVSGNWQVVGSDVDAPEALIDATTVSAVPEPGSVAILITGIAGFGWIRRRQAA